MSTLDQIIALLTTYKYFILFPVSILEGPIIAIIAGFLCSSGILNPFIAGLVLLLGDMTGDTLYYSLGRFGGRPFLRKWGHLFGVNEDKVFRTEEHFKKHAGKTILFGKTQAWGSVILTAAGLAKMPYGKYMWLNILGSILKVLIFLVLGYYFGKAYSVLNEYMGIYAVVSFALVIGATTIYFLVKRKQKK